MPRSNKPQSAAPSPQKPSNLPKPAAQAVTVTQQAWLSAEAKTGILVGIALLLLGGFLWLLSPILAPFLAAAMIAYIFDPIVDWLETKGLSRGLGAALAVVLLILALAAMILIILPLLTKELSQLGAQLPGFADQLKTRAIPWVESTLGLKINIDPTSFKQFITDNMQDASGIAKRVFSSATVGGLAVLGFLINLALLPVVLFYVLRDWDVLVGKIGRTVPRPWYPKVQEIAGEIDSVLSEFLRGQISVMLMMSVFYVACLWMVGLEFALPVGLVTGLLVFIPYLGSASGLLLGTVAAFMQFPSFTGVLMVWGVFAVGQILEGFVITPRFVGERIGLHPVAVIFALMAFGQVFGFFGVLLALPASAAILVTLRHFLKWYEGSRVYRG
jgi:predicted PurR-regulated permease PerM